MRAWLLSSAIGAIGGFPVSAEIYRCQIDGGEVVVAGPAGAGTSCRVVADPVAELGLAPPSRDDLATMLAELTDRIDAQEAEIDRLRARIARIATGAVVPLEPIAPPDTVRPDLHELETRQRVRAMGRELDRKLDALRPDPPLGPARQ